MRLSHLLKLSDLSAIVHRQPKNNKTSSLRQQQAIKIIKDAEDFIKQNQN